MVTFAARNFNKQPMRTLLLSAAALVAATLTAEAQCEQLFISEYIVGTGNDKAYEIYNPTDAPINLAPYELERWSNGDLNPTSGGVTNLVGTIPAYGTWVVANGQTEDIPLGEFVSPACSPELQALADQLDNPYPAPTYMNGNDALVLVFDGAEVCDIFGKPGEDPGIAWQAPDGTFITSGHTMIRKPDITGGVLSPPIVFDPLAEWDTLAINTWTNLGTHACNCDPTLGVRENKPSTAKVFPNPISNDESINIETDTPIERVEIFDVNGKLVLVENSLTGAKYGRIDIAGFQSGAYVVNVYMDSNTTYSLTVVKE